MSQNTIHNLSDLKENRKGLRSSLTSAEAFLWKKLQRSRLSGRKFRRQHSVGKYILDFYCPSEMLAVELDGMHHYTEEGIQNDTVRTQYLNALGIKVLRFENAEVFERTDIVLEAIKNCFNK